MASTSSPNRFRAFRIHKEGKAIRGRLEEIALADLTDGEVVVRVGYSSINYKDALAATGAGRILRRFPLVGGIDLAGEVHASSDARFRQGDRVVAVGGGLGEEYDGGYAEFARVSADTLVPLPDALTPRDAMAIGTAGFTAGLAIERMERNGQSPELGPLAITGASGGVGSLAIAMFAQREYDVVAISRKRDAAAYLEALGARKVLAPEELEPGKRPLENARWGGAVDNVGGDLLAWLTRTVSPGGNIASIGLAAGHELHTTVMPFILRGISLLGIHSVTVSPPGRRAVWERLATDLRPRHLERIVSREVPLDGLASAFAPYVEGKVTGRTVVRVGGPS